MSLSITRRSAAATLCRKRISAALDWCDTLVLLWSADAAQSYYVKQEWESAFHLQKRIIPCVLDGAALPALLRSRLYLNFSPYDDGYAQLCRPLGVERPAIQRTATPVFGTPNLPERADVKPAPLNLAKAELRALVQVLQQVIAKKMQRLESLEVKRAKPQLKLRSQPIRLTSEQVGIMLKKYDFYCRKYDWNKRWSNPKGKGINHKFETQPDGKVIVDHTTGLMWQQSGSPKEMNYADADRYIGKLNARYFTGHNDWRLPTLEEAMSLMDPRMHGDLYLDPSFDRTQRSIWTSDKERAGVVWVVLFNTGTYYNDMLNSLIGSYVRAVRGG
jgi:hypothetical protein